MIITFQELKPREGRNGNFLVDQPHLMPYNPRKRKYFYLYEVHDAANHLLEQGIEIRILPRGKK